MSDFNIDDMSAEELRGAIKGDCFFKQANQSAYIIEQQKDRIAELEQREAELAGTVAKLREALQNYTAEQVCCGQGEIQYSSDGEPIGQECCGKPDVDWPEDVVELLSATPRQNLNAIKLNALLDFRHDCGSMNGYNAVDVWDKMDEYIKREAVRESLDQCRGEA